MTQMHIVFRVGPSEYVVPMDTVRQLESYGGATPVPGTASYVVGVVQVRGKLIPTIDLRLRFGLPEAPPTIDTRVVIVEIGPRLVALVVDTGREVVSIPPESFVPPPPLVAEGAEGFVAAVAQLGSRVLFSLDLPMVVGEEHKHVE